MLGYALKNWRFIIHILFKTRHFGVNNQWWSADASALSWSYANRFIGIVCIIPIIRNYQAAKYRAHTGWIPKHTAKQYFP